MTEGKKNLFLEFQQHSTDFLQLLGSKTRADERSKTVAEELATLEFFWDGVNNIFQKYEEQLHVARLKCATDHLLLANCEQELRTVYNEFFTLANKHRDREVVDKLLQRTMIPTK